jgi:hypothetical protein
MSQVRQSRKLVLYYRHQDYGSLLAGFDMASHWFWDACLGDAIWCLAGPGLCLRESRGVAGPGMYKAKSSLIEVSTFCRDCVEPDRSAATTRMVEVQASSHCLPTGGGNSLRTARGG